MAEVDEIYNEIAAEAAQETALAELDLSGDTATSLRNDIDNGSIVGRTRLIAWVVAYVMMAQRALYRIFQQDTIDLALNGHYGTKRWWVAKVLEFQYGDAVLKTTLDSYYDPVVPANRVVTHAAVTEAANKVIIKAVKSSGTGLVPLSTDERSALQDYCQEINGPAIVEVRSAAADGIMLVASVNTDAQQGIPNIQTNAELAINNYLSSLDFNGVVSRTKLKQAVLAVPGVTDFTIESLMTRINDSSPWVNITRIAFTFSGHAKIDAAFPLSSSLTYTATNV